MNRIKKTFFAYAFLLASAVIPNGSAIAQGLSASQEHDLAHPIQTFIVHKIESGTILLVVNKFAGSANEAVDAIRENAEASLHYLKEPEFQNFIRENPNGTLEEFAHSLLAQGRSQSDELVIGISHLRALEDLNVFLKVGSTIGRGAVGVASAIITVYFANQAGNLSKAEGYGYADGFVDNLMSGATFSLVPGYIETNKSVTTALVNLSQDPSLSGSWLAEQANAKSPEEEVRERNRRAEQLEMGKMMYGPNYTLPQDLDP